MTTLAKTSLAICLVTFVAGFLTDAGSAAVYGFAKPISAIFFIVFFISFILEKEMAQYDEEHRLQPASTGANSKSAVTPGSSSAASTQQKPRLAVTSSN